MFQASVQPTDDPSAALSSDQLRKTVQSCFIDHVKMANLLDNVENSIWHAFDFLALEGDGTATKVKLKVRQLKNRNIIYLKKKIAYYLG